MELLAPAGNPLALVAAVRAGANAVYFGGAFNARMRARNFSNDEIAKAIAYCHKHGVKAYITINTILFDSEIAKVADYIAFLNEYGADALIIQDLAVAEIAKQVAPELELHASTQMGVHNSAGANLLKELGFSRVVLARELDIEEVKKIKETGIGVEVFAHGALCFGYSGQCLFSYCQTGRSGNRGLCAHICRLPWKLYCNEKLIDEGYLTSTKDLCTIERINEIAPFVDGIKIEGRLKNSQYVFDVVSAYRNALDGKKYALGDSFIGRKFTKGHLFGEPGRDLINRSSVDYKGELIGKVKSTKNGAQIELYTELKTGDSIRTNTSSNPITIYKIFKKGKQVNKASESCELRIKTLKKGDLLYRVSSITIEIEFEKFVPKKVRKSSKFIFPEIKMEKAEGDIYHIYDLKDMFKVPKNNSIIFPIELANEETIELANEKNLKVIFETPHICHDHEIEKYTKLIEEAKKLSPDAFLVSNLAFLKINCPIYLSYHLNVSNMLSANYYNQIANVKGIIAALETPPKIAEKNGFYSFTNGKPEVLISKHSLFKDYNLEGKCYLQDPRGDKLEIREVNSRMLILGKLLNREGTKNNYYSMA